MPAPTAYTPTLVKIAQRLITHLYRPGYRYWKAGVFLTGLVCQSQRQQHLFDTSDPERQDRLMEVMDQLNRRYARHTVRSAAMGFTSSWKMQQNHLSRAYTTRWNGAAVVKAK